MTLICIDRSQSPSTHKSNFLPGRKSPVNNNHNNNNNINQQNANSNHHHHRRNSCSPPISKSQQQQQDVIKSQNQESRKLERSASDPDRRAVQTNSSRYKTELCRPYEESGDCKYGDKCQFAHGNKELRTMQRHPKYKTELCRTFHTTGLCPYGPRCHFIHNSEQAKKSMLTNLTGNGSTTPSYSRQKVLTSLGSAGDISPPSSHGGTPTGMKSFDDLYKQQGPVSPGSLNPLVNLNHQSYDCGPLDCFSDAFNYLTEGGLTNGEVCLDNYGIIGGIISDYCSGFPATEDGYCRVPIYSRFMSKQ